MSEYLGGYFDAKGTICCVARKPSSKGSDFYVAISTSSQPQILEAIAAKFGGSVAERGIAGQRSVYSWRVCFTEAARFLEAVRPFVRLRAREIDLALEFYTIIKQHGGRSVTADTMRLRQRVVEQLAQFKKRKKRVA